MHEGDLIEFYDIPRLIAWTTMSIQRQKCLISIALQEKYEQNKYLAKNKINCFLWIMISYLLTSILFLITILELNFPHQDFNVILSLSVKFPITYNFLQV